MFQKCFTSVSKVYKKCLQKCFKSVSKVFQSCLFALKSSQLPEHKEGLFFISSALASTPVEAEVSFNMNFSIKDVTIETSPPYARVAAMTSMQTNNFETLLKHFCNTFDTLLKHF